MYPHCIRLRSPWECEPLARVVKHADGRVEMLAQALPPPCRMTLPCRWGEGGLPDFAGRVRFRRRFGIPRQIDLHEVVWLTFAGADSVAQVSLNGRLLGRHEGASEPFEFEVTGLLRDRNELVVEVEAPAGNGGLWGEVALEVRCTAFLRAVRAWIQSAGETIKLHVRGQAVGTSDRPLELYVLLDGRTIAYTTIEPTAAGRSFDLTYEDTEPDGWDRLRRISRNHEVRVDLVNGASIWYTVECPLESQEDGERGGES